MTSLLSLRPSLHLRYWLSQSSRSHVEVVSLTLCPDHGPQDGQRLCEARRTRGRAVRLVSFSTTRGSPGYNGSAPMPRSQSSLPVLFGLLKVASAKCQVDVVAHGLSPVANFIHKHLRRGTVVAATSHNQRGTLCQGRLEHSSERPLNRYIESVLLRPTQSLLLRVW
jgi:hypothetical protein